MLPIRIHCHPLHSTPPSSIRTGAQAVRLRQRLLVFWVLGSLAWGPACSHGLAQDSGQVPDKTTDQTKVPGEVSKPDQQDWKPLCDGKSLDGWKVTDVGGQGDVTVEEGVVSLGMGATLTAITYTREFPKCDYEFQMEARRVEGVDFFGTVTFPVGDAFCSLVLGGWGGSVVGISCINGSDASENETTKYVRFTKGQWYRIRIAVQRERIQAWIDDKPVVDLDTTHRKLSTRVEVYLCQPLGIASWVTRGELRNLQYRLLKPDRPSDVKETPGDGADTKSKPPAEEVKKSEAGGTDA